MGPSRRQTEQSGAVDSIIQLQHAILNYGMRQIEAGVQGPPRVRIVVAAKDWRAMLRRRAENARTILRKFVAERFVFTPNPAVGYLFKGEGDLGLLLQMASPTGVALLGLTYKAPRIRWILPRSA